MYNRAHVLLVDDI